MERLTIGGSKGQEDLLVCQNHLTLKLKIGGRRGGKEQHLMGRRCTNGLMRTDHGLQGGKKVVALELEVKRVNKKGISEKGRGGRVPRKKENSGPGFLERQLKKGV